MERRTFLKMILGGGLLGFLFGAGKGEAEKLLRPPGALPEEEFLATCARCGKCAEVCPVGCIKIAHGEKGLAIGTPYIVPIEAACKLCMRCTHVCTTGALRHIKKSEVRMGTAQIDTSCHTSCPQYNKAIWLEKNKYPTVNADYCTGCGMCEHVCIASPQKAIHIEPRG